MVLELSIDNARLSGVKEWWCFLVMVVDIIGGIGVVARRLVADDIVSQFSFSVRLF